MVRKSGYIGKGGVNVIFDRTESAQEKFENSQNIAHLPRNMCKKNQLEKATRWSSVRVFVRPCCVNRLQSTSHEISYRGPTRGLIELILFYTYSCVNGLCFGYFQIFPMRSPFDLKITLTPFPYVSRLSDLTVYCIIDDGPTLMRVLL